MSDEKVITFHRYTDRKNCQHNKFVVDPRHKSVECALCGKELNPIWVLEQLCNQESRARRSLDDLYEKIEKAKNKTRCKCEKCGEMTRIVRR